MHIDLSTLTEEQQTALLPLFTAMNQQIVDLQTKLAESGGSGGNEKITALEKQLTDMQAKLDAATGHPGGHPGGKPEDKKKTTTPDPQGTTSELETKLAALSEQIAALTGERENEKKAQTAQQIAEQVVAKKYPHATEGQKKSLIKRIAQATPGDEAAALTVAKEVETEWTEAGIAVKGFGADAKAEGKKDTPEPGSKEARIEAVKNRGRTNVAV
jgi:hypothetical protein